MEAFLVSVVSGFLGGLLGAGAILFYYLQNAATKDDVAELKKATEELVKEVKKSREPIQIG